MRIAALFGLVFLLAAPLHAQARRRPTLTQNQNNDGVIDLSDPLIFLPVHSEANASTAVNGSSVPVSQLRIPSKAVKEVERSQKAFEAGDVRASADHLEKAVQIYPDFLQARNILGTRYVRLGEYDKALAEYQTALAIDPHLPQTYHNLCVALFFLRSYSEAELAARHSLEFVPQHVASRYILGRALIAQGHATPEAIEMLRQSEDKFPNASLILATVLFKQGHVDQTITELRQYLKASPDPDNKQKAQCWLQQLSHEPLVASCTGAAAPPSFQ
jgi:tetratricopeptide (TPR) repeat protein